MQEVSYEEAIKMVAKFIGEDKYMDHKKILENFAIDPAKKFQSSKAREIFNRCFRALVVQLEKGIPLPSFSACSIPPNKPIALLLSLTKDEEEERERIGKEKEAEEQRIAQQKRELAMQTMLSSMSLSQKYYSRGYDSDDSDDSDDYSGYVGSNGKRYIDYSEWYESDSYDEDWHDD